MLVTEKEARTKICPTMSARRYAEDRDMGSCVTRLKPIYCKCKASDCMAWRWSDLKGLVCHKCNGWMVNGVILDTDNTDCNHTWVNERRGYCGLAGKPEEA